mmetsp:Transcript_37725/g.82685  ORF Transcript_37725/g.82685 Transcript_37725/m.82685 type:complete len:207 (-) Transcript_37725:189-809(-)
MRSASNATPSVLGDVGRVGSRSAIRPARRRIISPPVHTVRSNCLLFLLLPVPIPLGPITVRSTSRYPPSLHCMHSSVSVRSTASSPIALTAPKLVDRFAEPLRWLAFGTKCPWNHLQSMVGRRRMVVPWRVATGGPGAAAALPLVAATEDRLRKQVGSGQHQALLLRMTDSTPSTVSSLPLTASSLLNATFLLPVMPGRTAGDRRI